MRDPVEAIAGAYGCSGSRWRPGSPIGSSTRGPQGHAGAHRYSLDDYGLDAARSADLAPYLSVLDVVAED